MLDRYGRTCLLCVACSGWCCALLLRAHTTSAVWGVRPTLVVALVGCEHGPPLGGGGGEGVVHLVAVSGSPGIALPCVLLLCVLA